MSLSKRLQDLEVRSHRHLLHQSQLPGHEKFRPLQGPLHRHLPRHPQNEDLLKHGLVLDLLIPQESAEAHHRDQSDIPVLGIFLGKANGMTMRNWVKTSSS